MSLWTLAHSRQAELMDDPALATAEYLHALSALGRINALSRTASQLAAAIVRIRAAGSSLGLADCTDTVAHHRNAPRPIHVIDVACGGGDITVALARRLNRLLTRSGNPTSQAVHVTGIDVSPRAIQRAEALAARSGEINVSFEVRDVVANGCPPCDIATSSLFLHHLDDTTAVQIVRSLASASRCGVVVSDLGNEWHSRALFVASGSSRWPTFSACRANPRRIPLFSRLRRTSAGNRSPCVARASAA